MHNTWQNSMVVYTLKKPEPTPHHICAKMPKQRKSMWLVPIQTEISPEIVALDAIGKTNFYTRSEPRLHKRRVFFHNAFYD
jgi:hypothetical protein